MAEGRAGGASSDPGATPRKRARVEQPAPGAGSPRGGGGGGGVGHGAGGAADEVRCDKGPGTRDPRVAAPARRAGAPSPLERLPFASTGCLPYAIRLLCLFACVACTGHGVVPLGPYRALSLGTPLRAQIGLEPARPPAGRHAKQL
jgi:hypothetical protein